MPYKILVKPNKYTQNVILQCKVYKLFFFSIRKTHRNVSRIGRNSHEKFMRPKIKRYDAYSRSIIILLLCIYPFFLVSKIVYLLLKNFDSDSEFIDNTFCVVWKIVNIFITIRFLHFFLLSVLSMKFVHDSRPDEKKNLNSNSTQDTYILEKKNLLLILLDVDHMFSNIIYYVVNVCIPSECSSSRKVCIDFSRNLINKSGIQKKTGSIWNILSKDISSILIVYD